ncbi:distal tail protein Dit [Bacillus cereus group sp. BfR-BA-01326]|uniref:distal tail protein Dit n=1 Tax=Bacillus cereus group sp. BfR-BA-01326 TaxID=2920302 RepID=UPI001F58C9C5|nr:distal tail protein Dit [Bacillus cereus group sp. BfR-BA-01326]
MGSFKFNGIRKDYLFILMGFNRSAFAPIQRDIMKVTGLAGGHLVGTNTDVRTIEVPVILRADNQASMQKRKEELADWLIHDTPKELIFDDEPDRTYMALIDGDADLDELVFRGRGKITFVCPMPYKLGNTQEKTLAIESDTLRAKFKNNGTVESLPLIDITVGEKSPFLDVWSGDDYFRLGYPTGVQTKLVKMEDTVIKDEMNSLTPWTKVTGKIGNYTGTGDMEVVNNSYFKTKVFGAGTGWHGAIYTRDIPNSPLIDFRADMRVKLFSSYMNQVGKVVLMFLASDGSVVSELNMNDDYASSIITKANAVIGGNKTLVDTTGMYANTFNDFRGHYAIARRGTEWSVYFAKADGLNGVDGTSLVERWNDVNKENPATSKPITKVAIAFLQYGALSTPMDMWIEDLKVWKLYTINVDETPYIFDAGDKIQIDTEHSLVTINGSNAVALKDMFSRFPKVKRGDNDIIVRPSNIGTAKLTYRERYL